MSPMSRLSGSICNCRHMFLTVSMGICRERYETSLSMPYLPQQRVKMLWKDAGEHSKGEWYSGMVVQEGKEYGPHPQAVWEGVSVMWDADGSKYRTLFMSSGCMCQLNLICYDQCMVAAGDPGCLGRHVCHMGCCWK